MDMNLNSPMTGNTCPRCRDISRPDARFCARCGLLLADSDGRAARPGRIEHPSSIMAGDGFRACADAADLYFRWESAWGGAMLSGTESVKLELFNGGYPLMAAELEINGVDGDGRQVLCTRQTVDHLPRGRHVCIEVPSYELPAPVTDLCVSLVTAEFGQEP
jgi:hypothetical protein